MHFLFYKYWRVLYYRVQLKCDVFYFIIYIFSICLDTLSESFEVYIPYPTEGKSEMSNPFCAPDHADTDFTMFYKPSEV